MGRGEGVATKSGTSEGKLAAPTVELLRRPFKPSGFFMNEMNPSLNADQQEALFTLCLMAAFADGEKADSERAAINRIAESVLGEPLDKAAIYQDVLFQRVALPSLVIPLIGTPAAQLAYEMAVCVCDADDVLSSKEQALLENLRQHLELSSAATTPVIDSAQSLISAPFSPHPVRVSQEDDRKNESEKMILNYAILNGALELLPESLATMAIIPMQMKLVYRVGKLYGIELDRGHIKEFAAAAGVGMTSQVLEGFVRKLLKKTLGKKGPISGVANQVTSSAFSFASTYALGQVARSYYAGGRKMDSAQLKALFDSTVTQARNLHSQYLPQIQEKASGLDLGKILTEVTTSGSPTSV